MKKLLMIITILFISILTFSCGKKEKDETSSGIINEEIEVNLPSQMIHQDDGVSNYNRYVLDTTNDSCTIVTYVENASNYNNSADSYLKVLSDLEEENFSSITINNYNWRTVNFIVGNNEQVNIYATVQKDKIYSIRTQVKTNGPVCSNVLSTITKDTFLK